MGAKRGGREFDEEKLRMNVIGRGRDENEGKRRQKGESRGVGGCEMERCEER